MFLVATLTAASPAASDLIFDNYPDGILGGPTSSGLLVSGPNGNWNDSAARVQLPPELPAQFYRLESVVLPLRRFNSNPAAESRMTVSIYESEEFLPGIPVATSRITVANNAYEDIEVAFREEVYVGRGKKYWVVVTGVDRSFHLWAAKSPLTDINQVYRGDFSSGEWREAGADGAVRMNGVQERTLPVVQESWGKVKALYR